VQQLNLYKAGELSIVNTDIEPSLGRCFNDVLQQSCYEAELRQITDFNRSVSQPIFACLSADLYDTIGEFNVDSKAEYSALSSTRRQKKKLKQTMPLLLLLALLPFSLLSKFL